MAAAPASVDDLLQGLAYLSISWVTFTLGAILVGLRTHVRLANRATGWDDYFILIALIVAFFGSITNVYQVANGLGRHNATLTPEEQSGFEKWTLIAEVQVIIGTSFTKLSICFFILRLLSRTRKILTYVIYALMATVIVTTIGLVITFLLQCRPLNAIYDHSVAGKCYSKHVVFSVAYGQGAISILTDFICAGLPLFIIRNLRMKKKTKIELSLVMGLGVFTASCSIFRTAFLYLNYSEDATHANLVNVIFAMLEENLGIIAASVSTIRPLFGRLPSITRIHSLTADGRFARNRNFVQAKSKTHSSATLEEGSWPLYPTGITKTTAFKIDRSGHSDVRPEGRTNIDGGSGASL